MPATTSARGERGDLLGDHGEPAERVAGHGLGLEAMWFTSSMTCSVPSEARPALSTGCMREAEPDRRGARGGRGRSPGVVLKTASPAFIGIGWHGNDSRSGDARCSAAVPPGRASPPAGRSARPPPATRSGRCWRSTSGPSTSAGARRAGRVAGGVAHATGPLPPVRGSGPPPSRPRPALGGADLGRGSRGGCGRPSRRSRRRLAGAVRLTLAVGVEGTRSGSVVAPGEPHPAAISTPRRPIWREVRSPG